MAVLTQGTQLYFVDPVTHHVMTVACATSLDGVDASRDQIETTCLEGASRSYEPGLPTPGQASVGINFDPDEPSHMRIHELYVSGTKVNWAIGWSDGTAPPTSDSSDDLILPTTRTWLDWNGYVANCPFNFAINAVVASTVAIQLSDFPSLTKKT